MIYAQQKYVLIQREALQRSVVVNVQQLEPIAEAMRSYQTRGSTTNAKVFANVPSLLAQKLSLQSNNTDSFATYSNVSEDKRERLLRLCCHIRNVLIQHVTRQHRLSRLINGNIITVVVRDCSFNSEETIISCWSQEQ
jgi:hypothetical protein